MKSIGDYTPIGFLHGEFSHLDQQFAARAPPRVPRLTFVWGDFYTSQLEWMKI